MIAALILALALLALVAFLAWLAVKHDSILCGCLAIFVLLAAIGCGNIALTWAQR